MLITAGKLSAKKSEDDWFAFPISPRVWFSAHDNVRAPGSSRWDLYKTCNVCFRKHGENNQRNGGCCIQILHQIVTGCWAKHHKHIYTPDGWCCDPEEVAYYSWWKWIDQVGPPARGGPSASFPPRDLRFGSWRTCKRVHGKC